MISANEALENTMNARKAIIDAFTAEHSAVLDRIDELIRSKIGEVEVYYPNDGELSVDTYQLGLVLMELGYGVRPAIPYVEKSGIHIRWSRNNWKDDRDAFTWKNM